MKNIWIFLFCSFYSLAFANDMNALKEMFQKQFQPLSDTVYAEGTVFSGSKMSADLKALMPLANKIGKESEEASRLAFLQAVVYGRRGMFEELLPLAEQALNQDKLLMPYYDNTTRANAYVMFARELGTSRLNVSIHLFQYSLALFNKGNVDWSLSQEIFVKSYYGYLLHEDRQFQKAKTYNQDLLAYQENLDKETLLNIKQTKLRQKILANLAQNTYELKQLGETRAYLLKRLALVEGKETLLSELIDCHFQLGVLSAEQGDQKTAKIHLDKMLVFAKQSEYDYELKRAKERITYWKEKYLTKDK